MDRLRLVATDRMKVANWFHVQLALTFKSSGPILVVGLFTLPLPHGDSIPFHCHSRVPNRDSPTLWRSPFSSGFSFLLVSALKLTRVGQLLKVILPFFISEEISNVLSAKVSCPNLSSKCRLSHVFPPYHQLISNAAHGSVAALSVAALRRRGKSEDIPLACLSAAAAVAARDMTCFVRGVLPHAASQRRG